MTAVLTKKIPLKPCPNCGSKGHKLRVFYWDAETIYVECLGEDCRMSGPFGCTEKGACERWNELPRREE